MAKAMREQGYSTAKIQSEVMKLLKADPEFRKTVAENTKAYKQEIKEIIEETVKEAKRKGNKLVAEAGNMAWNDDLSVWNAQNIELEKPSSLSQLYEAFRRQTRDQLTNITRTTGFKGTILGTTGVLNMYQRSMDLAVLKLSTGTFSYDQVVRDLVHELAKSGLRTIDYASGRTYHLDTAARMIVRTTSSQLAGRITEMNIQKTGVELVYVDAHAGARPTHAVWQGKVYAWDNPHHKKYDDFESVTGYGTVTGLKGVNCTHNYYPYWEGDVIPDFKEPDPVTVNGKKYSYYEATQEQRKQERRIRATKREIEARKALGESYTDLNAKLKAQNQEYKQFSAAVNLRAKNSRLLGDTGFKTARSMDGRKIEFDNTKSFVIKVDGYSDEINSKLSLAARKMAEESAKTGCEHGVFVDLTSGNFYNQTKGDEDSVPFITKGLPNNTTFAFVHSHTRATPVSLPDLHLMITDLQTDIMVAARIDGVISYAEKKETTENLFDVLSNISSNNADRLSKYYEEDESISTRLEIEKIYKPDILKIFTKGEKIINE